MKKREGFTLAEILITLGIIGVVAAITLPIVIKNYQAVVLKTSLEKNYSVISNALKMMNNDMGGFKVSDFGWNAFAPQFIKYVTSADGKLHYHLDTDHTNDEGIGRISGLFKTYNNKDAQNTLLDDGQWYVADSSVYMIENLVSRVFISVDVNGIYKKPNKWGHDLFTFQVFDDGKVLPMGAEGTVYDGNSLCSKTSNSTINGIGCTYRALTEKDYFKNLP